jgi:DNA repair protein RecN (Recombination protein N)
LREEHKTLEKTYQNAAKALSDSRVKAAKQLNKKITGAMQTLGMKGGLFEINVSQAEDGKRAVHGNDRIEFTVTANQGQGCKPLARVASGGELARISLAIQMITASQGKISTLIFDEVDSGVGGGIAEIVGQHLRALGSTNQVVCITHLPQVASQAHHHLQVQKQSEKKQTSTNVNTLNRNQRVEEIARMLSGVDITEQSLAHAEEMITRAEEG